MEFGLGLTTISIEALEFSLVITVRTIAEKEKKNDNPLFTMISKNIFKNLSEKKISENEIFYFPDDKILCDADCADMWRYGDILNSLGPIRISFSRWVYI